MPLFDPSHKPQVDSRDQVAIVHQFLLRCRSWAIDKEIPERQARLSGNPDPIEEAKLQAWVSYLQFTDHTIAEIENGTLDHWFSDTNAD